jgi:hypothetical protein
LPSGIWKSKQRKQKADHLDQGDSYVFEEIGTLALVKTVGLHPLLSVD